MVTFDLAVLAAQADCYIVLDIKNVSNSKQGRRGILDDESDVGHLGDTFTSFNGIGKHVPQ